MQNHKNSWGGVSSQGVLLDIKKSGLKSLIIPWAVTPLAMDALWD